MPATLSQAHRRAPQDVASADESARGRWERVRWPARCCWGVTLLCVTASAVLAQPARVIDGDTLELVGEHIQL
jgi:hypothetical protein